MTGPEHYAKAEDLIHQATVHRTAGEARQRPAREYATPEQMIAAAQVHAMLALAAVLGSSGRDGADDNANALPRKVARQNRSAETGLTHYGPVSPEMSPNCHQ